MNLRTHSFILFVFLVSTMLAIGEESEGHSTLTQNTKPSVEKIAKTRLHSIPEITAVLESKGDLVPIADALLAVTEEESRLYAPWALESHNAEKKEYGNKYEEFKRKEILSRILHLGEMQKTEKETPIQGRRVSEWTETKLSVPKIQGGNAEVTLKTARFSIEEGKNKTILRIKPSFGIAYFADKDKQGIWFGKIPSAEFQFIESDGELYLYELNGDSINIRPNLVKSNNRNLAIKELDEFISENFPQNYFLLEQRIWTFSFREFFSRYFFSAGVMAANGGKISWKTISAENGIVCFEVENLTRKIKGRVWVDILQFKTVKVEEFPHPDQP